MTYCSALVVFVFAAFVTCGTRFLSSKAYSFEPVLDGVLHRKFGKTLDCILVKKFLEDPCYIDFFVEPLSKIVEILVLFTSSILFSMISVVCGLACGSLI